MIRSGSTLQYNITVKLVEKVNKGIGEGYFDNREFDLLDKKVHRWNGDKRYHIIKTHGVYPPLKENWNSSKIKMLYIYRDIRDVAASAKRKWGYEGKRLIDEIGKAIDIYYKLYTLPNIMFQRYENVIKNPSLAVMEISDWLNIKVSDDDILLICKETSISKAKEIMQKLKPWGKSRILIKIQKRLKIYQQEFDNKTLLHPDHISNTQGESDIWNDILSFEEIETIMYKYSDWLKHAKYI